MTIYIYALVDPFTDEIRYVGKSVRPKQRLADECYEVANTYRSHWIQSVIQKGERPAQMILEELPDDADWQAAERDWIAMGRQLGWRLTNTTDGGDGVPGLSGESKERMLKTWKGRKHSPESVIKIGRASRGRKFPEAAKQAMSEKRKGRSLSDTHRKGLSKKHLRAEDVAEIKEMLAQGVNQYEIAKLKGLSQSAISNIHRGISHINLDPRSQDQIRKDARRKHALRRKQTVKLLESLGYVHGKDFVTNTAITFAKQVLVEVAPGVYSNRMLPAPGETSDGQ